MSHVCMAIIRPRMRAPTNSPDEKLWDLLIDDVSYVALKAKCRTLAQDIEESFLVEAILHATLSWFAYMSDRTRSAEVTARRHYAAEYFKRQLVEELDEERRATLRRCISQANSSKDDVADETCQEESLYNLFCEQIVRPLLDERPRFAAS